MRILETIAVYWYALRFWWAYRMDGYGKEKE